MSTEKKKPDVVSPRPPSGPTEVEIVRAVATVHEGMRAYGISFRDRDGTQLDRLYVVGTPRDPDADLVDTWASAGLASDAFALLTLLATCGVLFPHDPIALLVGAHVEVEITNGKVGAATRAVEREKML